VTSDFSSNVIGRKYRKAKRKKKRVISKGSKFRVPTPTGASMIYSEMTAHIDQQSKIRVGNRVQENTSATARYFDRAK